MKPLTRGELRRLAAIMERCASPYDGEKLAALNLAQQMLSRHGARWSDVLNTEPTPPAVTSVRGWNDCARDLLHYSLTEWEIGFLQSLILKTRGALSPKQEGALRGLCLKFGVALWATP
jgi:hypothetical protein